MASRPYSTRFLKISSPGVWWEYRVPAGYRAVLKSISAANGGTLTGPLYVQIGGTTVYMVTAPGGPYATAFATAQVAYAAEVIRGYVQAEGMQLFASGYLLLDDGSMDDGHDDVVIRRYEQASTNPSGA